MKPTKFARFYTIYNGRCVERLGSDGVVMFDGRLSIFRQIAQARDRARMLNAALGAGIIGFDIHCGTFTHSCVSVGYTSL